MTTYKKCTKVKGKEHCKRVKAYRPVTLASAKGSLTKSGKATITLKLSKFYVRALEKHKRVTASLAASVTSRSTHKRETIKKTITFRR